jgi:hypothetical protein
VTAPAPPATDWAGLRPTWTGWDGSVWDLTDPASGVLLMRGGTRGLTMPPIRRYTSASPAVPGSRWRGAVPDERDVFWPLLVLSETSSQAWVQLDRAFWRTMDPARPGVWAVTHPSGETRRLRCRFVDDGNHTFDLLPVKYGWTRYGVSLVAEAPYWEGTQQVRYFGADPPVLFFTADASVFALDPEQTVATATMDNPGDVDAYPVWTISGPSDRAVLGVGGRLIEVPFPVPAGKELVVDPRPTAQTAIDSDGNDRTGELGAVDFAPIPPGESVTLSLELVGDGFISAALTPLHYRAW